MHNLLISFLLTLATVFTPGSGKVLFDKSWSFSLDGGEPKTVNLPHDWSIEGEMKADNPMGNESGYYPAGIGVYKNSLTLESVPECLGLYFEGCYQNAEVYVNGSLAGSHHYGYTAFNVDITKFVKPGANDIEVRVDNSSQPNCRWYSGSGIYRHVWLKASAGVHIKQWGTYITTPEVSASKATVRFETMVQNETARPENVTCEFKFAGKTASSSASVAAGGESKIVVEAVIDSPRLWSPEHPEMYEAEITLVKGDGTLLDSNVESFGIRTISWSAEDGFVLNGKSIDINGGCVHHDNGILGAAAFDAAEYRRVKLLKEAGFTAIRTSHNPPSEAFLAACDELGLLVVDEAFDGWRKAKLKGDYSIHFDDDWQKDLDAMVLRDRNHPSVISWSIGNEVYERKELQMLTTAMKLAGRCHELDPTRPVTEGLASWDRDWEIYDPLIAVHDIAGYNYLINKAEGDHARLPERVIWQTESYPCDAFKNWELVNDKSYILGDFVWTAVDYLGESSIGRWFYDGETPGPHYGIILFPWHGAYCGDIDLTGWRKPISHYRELLYSPETASPVYLAVREPDGFYGKINLTSWAVWPTWESWTWEGWEGKDIEVEVISRLDAVRLYLNGKLIGEKPTTRAEEFKAVFKIPYEPGTLRAVGVKNGVEVNEQILETASAPASIRLTADKKTLVRDGQDLSFVTVEILDKKGRVVPEAKVPLEFTVKGAGSLAAAGNANLQDVDSTMDSVHNTWKGRALAVVRASEDKGTITLTVKSAGLKPASLVIK